MTDRIIEIHDIKKDYVMGKEIVHALNGINFSIEKNDFLSIVGTSGSGKSTLLHIIGGIDKPTEGYVLLDGENLSTMKDNRLSEIRRDKIGLVYQNFMLIPEWNALENILFPALLKKEKPDESYIKRLCNTLGLENLLEHRPFELSGGQQQRVAIARALVNKPDVILCDEPTGSLDRNTSIEVIEFLAKLHKEFCSTIVLVTHDSMVASYTEKCYSLEDGRICL